ncbi:hypothetical protein BD309DRAFT_304451 [Dichomitus squalens]|uniref:Uncharacterized protein n=1 Tax=Dichomitus squalens TaxID=114155 RepID=A0A4Q9NII6_9APHY|nr:hypothetical protein BD309DRAFT_304451 [Dichomitus squalens]TBU59526.1 hypothetical protein BD310DRAFT_409563 [Dichomitus squalens]
MPGLIQRHNAVAEYSALITTNPTTTQRRRVRKHEHEGGESAPPRLTRVAIREEASDWYDAVAPPLEDLQAVIRRMQADPELSQDRLFSYLWPVVVLATVFAVAVIAVQEGSYVHRILDSPENYWLELGRFAALAVGGVVVGVLSLKCIIYGFAELCAVVASLETSSENMEKEEKGVPTRGLVLGGMFM